MQRIYKKMDAQDFTSEINMELEKLIALGELVRQMPVPCETRDEFFSGLADMIAGGADRIKEMLDPTYDFLSQRSKDSEHRP